MTKKSSLFNNVTQVILPTLTIAAQVALAMKLPQYALLINLLVQPFWLYSSYKAYKEANQSGILITAVILTVIMLMGTINYWLL